MITNLIFKRTVTAEGSNYSEYKIVEMNVPEIKKSEKWELVGMADSVSVAPTIEAESPKVTDSSDIETTPTKESTIKTDVATKPDKFKSPNQTKRMMIRQKDYIRVVNRTSTDTTYNAVSITETEKIEFYNSFRSKNPNPSAAKFEDIILRKTDVVVDRGYGTSPYAFWDNFMEQRYLVERDHYMKTEGKN